MAHLRTAALLVAAALVLAACSSGAGGCVGSDDGAGCFLRHTLIGCAPPPPGTQAAEPGDGAAFRAALAPLLAALPSAAAATGFASLRSAGTGRAHALGLCFGENDRCIACLSAAAAAVTEGCSNDTRRGGAWRDGCLLAYADDGDEGGAFQFLAGGDTRDQVLADLARALAETKGKSLWKMALSVLFYVLAAVGAIAIVLLLCAFIAIWMLAETLVSNSAAGHTGAGQGQAGEGFTAYVAATNGQAPLWSVAAHVRLY